MPIVKIAEHAGVCFGVRRALKLMDDALSKGFDSGKKVFMLGPLIHNPRVIDYYISKGVTVTDNLYDVAGAIAVIRSHGITEAEEIELEKLENSAIEDTTCPFVKKIHLIVKKRSAEGFAVIVLGDENHSEVKGIISRIESDFTVVSPDDFSTIKPFLDSHEKIIVVAQTTSKPSTFDALVAYINENSGNCRIITHNTVCDATFMRQREAAKLAGESDSMVIIGGKNSSNTAKLFNVVREINPSSFWIESPADLSEEDITELSRKRIIGLTAGASTPDVQIEEIKTFLEAL